MSAAELPPFDETVPRLFQLPDVAITVEQPVTRAFIMPTVTKQLLESISRAHTQSTPEEKKALS